MMGLGRLSENDLDPPTGDCAIGLEQGVDLPPFLGMLIGSVLTCIGLPKSTTGSDCSELISFGWDSVNSVACKVDRFVGISWAIVVLFSWTKKKPYKY